MFSFWCLFGDGTQIIGNINVYNCTLESGEDFKHSDPNKSAGLIKGRGTAKNITVPKGKVINGLGDYNQKELELQENITNRLWFEK